MNNEDLWHARPNEFIRAGRAAEDAEKMLRILNPFKLHYTNPNQNIINYQLFITH